MREELRAYPGHGTIALELEDTCATLILCNEAGRNALSGRMLAELADAVEVLEGWNGRALLVRGAGSTFCAGADLNMVRAKAADSRAGRALAVFVSDLLMRIRALPVISIAAIEGYALGGGAELATACDFRIMASDARIGFVHARLGLSPAWGGGRRLTTLVGRQRALLVLGQARRLDAATALAWGLVDRVAQPGAAVEGAHTLLEPFLELPAESVRAAKSVVHAACTLDAVAGISRERAVFESLWGGEAHLARLRELDIAT